MWVWMSESHVVVFEPEDRCCQYIELPLGASPSHPWEPRLNRRSHLCTACTDASRLPQPLYLHLVHHAYTVD
jgi:hypothetical protein